MQYFKSIFFFYFLALLSIISCKTTPTKVNKQTTIKADYLIKNVSVIPMTEEIILKNRSVLIEDGKISKIGEQIEQAGITEIDGTGKFLIPGLTEMHAHIPVAQDGDDILVKETLFLYLSQGITNIRGMLGNPYHLKLKKQVADGEILSPRIYTSSPSLNGNSIRTPEEARTKITQYQKAGYDFLKIHPGIKLNVWKEVERTANEVGIPFAGHVPVEVGIRRALNAKYQTVDHLDGYMEGLVPKSAKIDPTNNGFFGYNFAEIVDPSLIPELVDLTLQNEVGIVTTQTLFTRWFSPESPAEMVQQPEMKYMSPKMLYTWRQNKTKAINDPAYSIKKWEKFIDIRDKLLREMDAKGVNFLLGSDAPQVFNVPGFSIHHELKTLAKIGIENFKLLQSGTINPAKFFNALGEYGTIEEGKVADLVLLSDNPLVNIENAQKIEGVMVGKTWMTKPEIANRLAEIARQYQE